MPKNFVYPTTGITSIHFNDEGMLIKSAFFKYLMLETPAGQLQMLLMIEGCPYDYHAEALLDYMDHSNLSEIKTNGGGKIRFLLENQSIFVEGKSFAFGKAYPPEVTRFLQNIFPEFDIKTDAMNIDLHVREMAESGAICTREKVKWQADHP